MATNEYSPLHPHEPQIPPALDDEGRCLVCGILVERDEFRRHADNLAQKIEWAYNDACFTAPEDTERMNRHWNVMTTALRAYREVETPSDERKTDG